MLVQLAVQFSVLVALKLFSIKNTTFQDACPLSKEPLCQTSRSESRSLSLLRTKSSKKLELFKIPVLLWHAITQEYMVGFLSGFFLLVHL